MLKSYDFTVKTKLEIQADIDLVFNTFDLFLDNISCVVEEIVNDNICFTDYYLTFKIPYYNTSTKIKLSNFFHNIQEDENKFYFDLSELSRKDHYKNEQNVFSKKYNDFIEKTFITLNQLKLINNAYIYSPILVIDKNRNLDSYIQTGVSVKPYESNLIPEHLKIIENTKRINRIKVLFNLSLSELNDMNNLDSEFDFLAKVFENDYLYECITKEIPIGDTDLKGFLKEILNYRKLVGY